MLQAAQNLWGLNEDYYTRCIRAPRVRFLTAKKGKKMVVNKNRRCKEDNFAFGHWNVQKYINENIFNLLRLQFYLTLVELDTLIIALNISTHPSPFLH